ncbi:mechanosensitive ion channel family protein [Sphingobium sp. Ant17]|uniref:mechanosensitive ion channel family protein n=1 Tax=Sphingobium sp. Ant17 TaxID=1461752 RepID=UPI00044FB7EC|nr:mechanosensitive ion channel domain-containing protein [Sphingobium sp. Ant17]EXS69133.1 mechanosensitive ion channel protein MscS [Sphingobium sp. Ant17]|tara:strand:- start:3331 stop:4602 length:1272 start_codon:yes stop_codon:yes gene_type:complete
MTRFIPAKWLALLEQTGDLIQAGIALGVAILLYLLAAALARVIARRVEPHCAHLGTAFVTRVRPIVRHGLATLLIGIATAVWPTGTIANILLAMIMGGALALVAGHLARGVSIPLWATIPLAVMVFVMLLSGSTGGITPLAEMLDSVGLQLGRSRISLLDVISVAAIAVGLFGAARLANRVLSRSISSARSLDATQKLLAEKLAGVTVIAVAFFFGIDVLGIDLTAFAVFSGALGLAVGFGLQKTVGNLIAGIILLLDRSIKPGDVIVVGESFGWVNKIGVRAVSVITRDGKEHLIPNENLMTQEVENWSYSDRNVRVHIPVGIAYDSDLDLAQKLMLQAASESPRVLKSPKPNVWLKGFGDSSVDHDILVWISDPESGVGNVRSDVLGRLWHLFRDHGVTIPFPQLVVHMVPPPPPEPTDAL